MKSGETVITPAGPAILEAKDKSGRHWLVTHPGGDQRYWDIEALHPSRAIIEAVDANGEHWRISPPEGDQQFWSMESIPAIEPSAPPASESPEAQVAHEALAARQADEAAELKKIEQEQEADEPAKRSHKK
jgi:hypothetical protein